MEPVHTLAAAATSTLSWLQTLSVVGVIAATVVLIGVLVIIARRSVSGKDPTQSVESVLESVQDEDLKKEVRAAIMEPFGRISEDEALSSVKRLYDAHLVKKIEEIRSQLKQYGSGAAPAELVRRHMEIIAEKNRVGAFKA